MHGMLISKSIWLKVELSLLSLITTLANLRRLYSTFVWIVCAPIKHLISLERLPVLTVKIGAQWMRFIVPCGFVPHTRRRDTFAGLLVVWEGLVCQSLHQILFPLGLPGLDRLAYRFLLIFLKNGHRHVFVAYFVTVQFSFSFFHFYLSIYFYRVPFLFYSSLLLVALNHPWIGDQLQPLWSSFFLSRRFCCHCRHRSTDQTAP